MKTDPLSPFAVSEKFTRVVKLWQQLEKKPRKFGLEEALNPSEIHLIEIVGEREDLSVTDIAGLLGITKGAVSQTLKKMINKGLMEKKPDPLNSSRALIRLTSKGKVAFYAHMHWHEKMDGGFRQYFTNLPEDKIRFLYDLLNQVESFFLKQI
jgi:DNA-binding MarR family transcriptional regulator